MPLRQPICFQSAVVPIVGIGVIKPLTHSCCFGIGVDVAERIECSFVVFGGNGCLVIPCIPKVLATPCKAVEQHCGIPSDPMQQFGQLGGI